MQDSLPSPFGPGAGIRSYYLLELSGAADGLLLLMHTDAMARGFTMLCRELGLRLVEVAEDVIGAALHRERLRLEIEALNATARRDPLTGLFNRRAWDEALAAHDGNPASIVLLDLDDLKRVNDEKGHASGDDVLRTLAGVVRENVREDDLVARIGGDEIAVLMPDADESSCREVVARLETAIAGHPGVHGFPLSAAVGHGSCDTGTRLVDLLERADERMYEQKAGRAPRRLSA
jgi:diguanylate cyclase (GGDEF)-like protein